MNDVSKSSVIRLISYLTDTQGHDHRVAGVRVSNCASDDAQWAAMEMLVTQNMNTRSRGDKTYHLLLSFQAHERPSMEVIREIEDKMCARLGFDGHQRVSVLHNDTDNFHLHICINKIHPERLTMYTPYYDHKTLAVACVRLEKQHSLAEDNHVPRAEAAETAAKNMEHGGDMESFIGWIQRNILEKLKKAETWAEMNTVLHEYGLELKERGNGFVFLGGGVHVKASSVDRSLSRKKLEARLGPFVPIGHIRTGPSREYEKRPMRHRSYDSSELWRTYQKWREDEDVKRTASLNEARRLRDAGLSRAQQAADIRTLVIRNMVTGAAMKRILHAMNRAKLRRRKEELRAHYRSERLRLSRRVNVNWRSWLQEEARAGNPDALAALRSRDVRTSRNPIRSGHPSEVVKVTGKGTVIFADGVRDTGLPGRLFHKKKEQRRSQGR